MSRRAAGGQAVAWRRRAIGLVILGHRPHIRITTEEGALAMTTISEDAMAQIAHLRQQVETLMREKVTPVMEDAAGRASAASREAADAVAEEVRTRPLTALLIAVGVGFLVGRMSH
jgi:ElaB/YqjD/DUF883 family membrane-anchored ribosome-binding protein